MLGYAFNSQTSKLHCYGEGKLLAGIFIFKKFLNTLSKIKGVLWAFNHLVLSSKHIERKINSLNYRMVNFKRITCIRKSNPWFTTAILFFKAVGWSSCFVKLLISWKEHWMLSDQNARQDVIIQSCMCIFYTLILHRTLLPFKMIGIVFCFVHPKQYHRHKNGLLERDSKKLILSLILKGVTSTGGGHRTWGHNYSTMEKDAGFWMGDTQVSQEIKLFSHLSEWQTKPCSSLRSWTGYTHLSLQALIYCLYLLMLLCFCSWSSYVCRSYSIHGFP